MTSTTDFIVADKSIGIFHKLLLKLLSKTYIMCYDEIVKERSGAMKFTSFVKGLKAKEKVPFIISLSVIMLAVLALIAYGIFTLVGIIWLNNYKIEFYSPPFDDYVELSYYSANRGELLGKGDFHHTYYELDGLPMEDYLLIDKASGFVTVSHDEIVAMSEDSVEPIFRYDVKKIEIQDGEQTLTITAQTVIDGILKQVRSGERVIKEDGGNYAKNTTVCFDLPCELTLECIIVNEGDKVLLLCFDHAGFDWCEYDVTEQLSYLF